MIAASTNYKVASLSQILLWYDGPQILLLECSALHYIVAVPVPSKENEDVFVGALVTKLQLADYQAERFDLRYLMFQPSLRKWFTFSLDDDPTEFNLKRIKGDSPNLISALPDPGFFSRGHETIDCVSLTAPSAVERFLIDGSWDLGEFSKFYGQIEDIYYIYNGLDRHKTGIDDHARWVEAFMRPWQGGGSYLGFYNEIANDNDPQSRLRVSGIQYNSPGYVEVRARSEPFDEMIGLFSLFFRRSEFARNSYRALHGFLGKNKLLKAKSGTYLSEDSRQIITKLSVDLANKLNNLDYTEILKMADNNPLVAAKVVLSIHRRTEKVIKLFEQGRVKYEGVNI